MSAHTKTHRTKESAKRYHNTKKVLERFYPQKRERDALLALVARSFDEAAAQLLMDFAEKVGSRDMTERDELFRDLHDKYGVIGTRIRGARAKEGLTQLQLAKKLGIEQGDLSKMENGKRPVGLAMAKRLAKALRVSQSVFTVTSGDEEE